MRQSKGYAWRVPVRRRWNLSAWLPGASFVSVRSAAVVTAVWLLAGCGGSHIGLQKIPSTPSPGSASTGQGPASTIPSDDGQDPAILAAYAGSVSDFDAVATKAPVQGNSPVLANHMSGGELESVGASLLKLANAGQVNTGVLSTLHADVKQFEGTSAVVAACNRDVTG